MRNSGMIWFFVVLIAVGAIVFLMQASAAADCYSSGGVYIKTWTGWPACVPGQSVVP